MNFKQNEKDLQRLLYEGTRTSSKGNSVPTYFKGVYLISGEKVAPSYKIGMAFGQGGLFNRLMSYKICWPYINEFYLHFAIVCYEPEQAKQLETILLAHDKLQQIEKAEDAQGRRSNEYRVAEKRTKIFRALDDTLNARRDLWAYLLLFGEKGWRLQQNTGDNRLIFAEPRKSWDMKDLIWDPDAPI